MEIDENIPYIEGARSVLLCSSEAPDESKELPADDGEKYTVMISSSVHNFKDQLITIRDYFHEKGYNVVMSMDGTIFANPKLGNFQNCLNAVENCDIFFGIIRPFCGTGRDGGESITFKEFKHARKCHIPSWYVIDNRISDFHNLFHALRLRKDIEREDVNKAINDWLDELQKEKKKPPFVMDLFEPDRSRRYFDPECFKMEDFVNQPDDSRSKVVNNWMHYFDDISGIKTFIDTNFNKKEVIEEILKEM